MSLLVATRHFQKFGSNLAGTMDLKEKWKPGILKKVLNSGTLARKLFQIIWFSNQWNFPRSSHEWPNEGMVLTHKHIAIALRRKTFIFIGH